MPKMKSKNFEPISSTPTISLEEFHKVFTKTSSKSHISKIFIAMTHEKLKNHLIPIICPPKGQSAL